MRKRKSVVPFPSHGAKAMSTVANTQLCDWLNSEYERIAASKPSTTPGE